LGNHELQTLAAATDHDRLARPGFDLAHVRSGAAEQDTTMSGQWMKRPRWKVSHFIRDDAQRPRHLGNEVGMSACGKFVTIDEGLEYEPTGIDTCDRCNRCERRLGEVLAA
jgi:hypothetical protein